MNIRQLEAFKAIVELGSFTRAGERLHLSQPAVSKLILLLERNCGFALFHRQKNGVIPTAEGEMLYSEVERVFLGVDSVSARARAIRQFDYGEIEIVAFPSLATRILPPILAEFLGSKPGLRVTMSSRNSWLLVDRVASQGVDVGFGMLASERPGVHFEKLCSMDAVCVLPAGHRLAARPVIEAGDLHGERFVAMAEEDRAQLKVDQAFSDCGAVRDIVLKAQLTEACCSFVASGIGVAVVDPLSTVDFAPAQLVVRPFRPRIAYDIWVVTPSFRETALASQALIAHVRTRLTARIVELAERIGAPE
ncbi:LysR substrate-binding domain-containing protein [Azospirillum doebereinerae]|uniref:LysR family transcriptional regulator n=1 Tax=Azospirillum doebereinerae TaxID=92933 RepID=A0A433J3K4_9PROT|nr:LysR substrate-binding domain-containing protein [Azospirillum doebereinerae]MCG5241316.1 LysR substrate-binding domain-containing protein [Azospirillum doebereinerae]RUQ66366.1 LysR family transcriptional regulator [Azospirillum doebereinerae]